MAPLVFVNGLDAKSAQTLAHELVHLWLDPATLGRMASRIDWTLRENVRANLRRLVKRILRRHGYPPDKQEKATRTALEQAEVLSEGWAG